MFDPLCKLSPVLTSIPLSLLIWSGSCLAADPPLSIPRTSSLTEVALQEEALYLKEETVVTAIRREQPISQSPSNLYVITEEDIRLSGATDIPTLLRRVPGMEVMQMTAGEFNVSARGNNQQRANKLLVLVDGRSAYIDLQATVPWVHLPITFPEIKRIEVLKGPASTIYGFNAFDGVVNIITKSGAEMAGTTIQTGYGELGTLRSAGVQAGMIGKFDYRLSIGRDQQQQWRDRDALGYRLHRFNGQATYTLTNDAFIKLAGGIVDTNRFDFASGDFLRLNSATSYPYGEILYERPNFFLRFNWQGITTTVDTEPRTPLEGLIATTDKFGSSRGVPYDGHTYNIESQYIMKFGPAHRLTFGGNYRRNTISGTQLTENGHEDRFGLYVQDDWRLTANLTLNAGIRIDLHNELNPTYSPRVAIIYSPRPNHTIRLSGSVAYRTPTLVETFQMIPTTITVFGFNNTDTLFGNKNLAPEQIVSYDASYQGWYFSHRVRLRADVFYNRISKLITPMVIDSSTSSYLNSGETDIYGGETGIEILAATWLRGFANLAYQDVVNQSTIDPQVRRGAPRFKINAGLQGNWSNGFNAEAAVHYVDSTTYPLDPAFQTFAGLGLIPQSAVPHSRVDHYTLLNLRCGYRFWHDRAEAAVSVFNALNDRHQQHPLADVLGSRVMGWLTLKL
ncbi:MAG: TonB-dependent receptor [Nitrospira sp.]|nr:TonB-dependent receptor [Nitrospira sp.]MDH4305404.1 TonB-dependent receptor [Nitrospira sp.]MDH5194763.1 TonB-dependent receptor [Nitrospira sp.]